MKCLKSLIIAIAVGLCFAWAGYAADYYVDKTGGNDSWNGQYPEYQGGSNGPWKTVSKVNNCSFNPGDSIKFKCGQVWWETLIFPVPEPRKPR